ncbi:MAG: DUF4286 family protein [Muribaculaceae bacterium]|nr:DUF4286 family protein [Muribaculaceae bacterium]
MILYNTSFHVITSIEVEFLEWIKDKVIPPSVGFGFRQPLLTRLLTSVDDGCSAFALQFMADDISYVEHWEAESRHIVMADMYKRWGENALAFSTIMEVIEV